jgi:phage baseplate assembly protein W
MTDYWLDWQNDFLVSPQGGLVLVDGVDEARQRLMRRLCTAVKGYIWHPEYGAGLPQKIGDPWQPPTIEAIIRDQIGQEISVAQNPPPRINVSEVIAGIVSIDISYISAQTGLAVQFNIAV